MRKILFFSIGIVLLCLAGWGVYKIRQPHRNAASIEETADLSADSLYRGFIHSEQQADGKWTGKIIKVSGVISSVSENGNYVSVSLRASDAGSINCSLQKKDFTGEGKYMAGDYVSIKGKCTGFLMDVNLVDCVIEKNKLKS